MRFLPCAGGCRARPAHRTRTLRTVRAIAAGRAGLPPSRRSGEARTHSLQHAVHDALDVCGGQALRVRKEQRQRHATTRTADHGEQLAGPSSFAAVAPGSGPSIRPSARVIGASNRWRSLAVRASHSTRTRPAPSATPDGTSTRVVAARIRRNPSSPAHAPSRTLELPTLTPPVRTARSCPVMVLLGLTG